MLTKISRRHSFMAFLLVYLALPLLILAAVTACTAIAILPIAWIMCWL